MGFRERERLLSRSCSKSSCWSAMIELIISAPTSLSADTPSFSSSSSLSSRELCLCLSLRGWESDSDSMSLLWVCDSTTPLPWNFFSFFFFCFYLFLINVFHFNFLLPKYLHSICGKNEFSCFFWTWIFKLIYMYFV